MLYMNNVSSLSVVQTHVYLVRLQNDGLKMTFHKKRGQGRRMDLDMERGEFTFLNVHKPNLLS